MPEPGSKGEPEVRDAPDLPAPDDGWADIARDGLDVWLSQGTEWYERSRDRRIWKPEDVVGDCTNLVEHLTPLAERSFNLSIELLRPWARAINERSHR